MNEATTPQDRTTRAGDDDVIALLAELDALAYGTTPTRGDTRKRILATSAGLFRSRGFTATSTRILADGAGITPAGIYTHFASKDELLGATFAYVYSNFIRSVFDGSSADDPFERVEELVRRQLDYEHLVSGEASWFELLIDNDVVAEIVPPEYAEVVGRARKLHVRRLADAIEEATGADGRLAAEAMIRLCGGFAAVSRARGVEPAEIVDEFHELVLRLLPATEDGEPRR